MGMSPFFVLHILEELEQMHATAVSHAKAQVVSPFDLHHSIKSLPNFFGPGKLPTVTMMPIWENKICLVRPKDADSDQWWVLPQEQILLGDSAIISAALRGLQHKLGLKESDVAPHRFKPLEKFENLIPQDRKRNAGMTKVHYLVGMPINHPRDINPNRSKITALAWVQSDEVFEAMTQVIAEVRPVKHAGIKKGIRQANERGMITWTVH